MVAFPSFLFYFAWDKFCFITHWDFSLGTISVFILSLAQSWWSWLNVQLLIYFLLWPPWKVAAPPGVTLKSPDNHHSAEFCLFLTQTALFFFFFRLSQLGAHTRAGPGRRLAYRRFNIFRFMDQSPVLNLLSTIYNSKNAFLYTSWAFVLRF